MFIDLDNFKNINDSYGHSVGDQLLVAVAQRLKKQTRESDTLARNGGDEFVFILENLTSEQDVALIAKKLIKSFTSPFHLNNLEVRTSISIGISVCPFDGDTSEVLLRNADSAMYKAKENGRNNFSFYTQAMTDEIQKKVILENHLRQALHNDELFFCYQAQYDINSKQMVGLEALARWRHPQQGLISPDDFIPVAEQSGLIEELGRWSLQHLFLQGKLWLDQGFNFGRLSINISGRQLQNKTLYQDLMNTLTDTGFPSNKLTLEVTESSLMENMQQAIVILTQLKAQGINIAIDDFGTGYSSLSYLKRLPINELKIDRAFIRDIPEDKDDVAIVNTIISLAKNLGLTVVAEDVETVEQVNFLQTANCYIVQGYYFSKPITAEEWNRQLPLKNKLNS